MDEQNKSREATNNKESSENSRRNFKGDRNYAKDRLEDINNYFKNNSIGDIVKDVEKNLKKLAWRMIKFVFYMFIFLFLFSYIFGNGSNKSNINKVDTTQQKEKTMYSLGENFQNEKYTLSVTSPRNILDFGELNYKVVDINITPKKTEGNTTTSLIIDGITSDNVMVETNYNTLTEGGNRIDPLRTDHPNLKIQNGERVTKHAAFREIEGGEIQKVRIIADGKYIFYNLTNNPNMVPINPLPPQDPNKKPASANNSGYNTDQDVTFYSCTAGESFSTDSYTIIVSNPRKIWSKEDKPRPYKVVDMEVVAKKPCSVYFKIGGNSKFSIGGPNPVGGVEGYSNKFRNTMFGKREMQPGLKLKGTAAFSLSDDPFNPGGKDIYRMVIEAQGVDKPIHYSI